MKKTADAFDKVQSVMERIAPASILVLIALAFMFIFSMILLVTNHMLAWYIVAFCGLGLSGIAAVIFTVIAVKLRKQEKLYEGKVIIFAV